jgi:serine phosphatase RsbU (regulator of sigma subunit)
MIADRSDAALHSGVMAWRSSAGRTQAGGDWCDVLPVAPGVLASTIGDVSGHCPAASAAMPAIRAAVVDAIAAMRVPSAVLARANAAAHA